MPNRMPKNISNRISENTSDKMPEKIPENISNRMPEDLPIIKHINVMVGITRSKVILRFLIIYFYC